MSGDVARPAKRASYARRESSRCESWRTRAGSSAESSTSLRRWNGSPRICSSVLKAHLHSELLLAEPIVYTLDEGTLSRYERRVLIK